ncbi:MAG: hypothetical protein KIT31_31155 [Deltaproteobacteria bacterium]|nr:hypothetical protein [Deltaproteobacteria bacterium]
MRAQPAVGASDAVLAVLSPPATDDARSATAIGPSGEVYEPDGKGGWVRTQRIATADPLTLAARAGGAVVASGNGVVYRLAANGWSAIRLVQKGKAVLAGGPRAIAAAGKQLFALDRTAGGEPAKLAATASPVVAIGTGPSGKTAVVQTERGLLRLDGARLTAITGAPRGITQLVGDTWAIADGGAADLRTGKTLPFPAGLAVGASSPATVAPDDSLAVVATGAGGALELVTVRGNGKVDREPIVVTAPGVAVGLAVDRTGRAVVALRDGRLAVRDRGTWSTTTATTSFPPPRPGPPPATSP